MQKKILFTDLDGTLLNDERRIANGNMEAIDKALELGHKIVITTGRPLDSALMQAEASGLNKEGFFIIAFNGANIYDCSKKENIYTAGVDYESIRYFFDQAAAADVHCHTYAGSTVLSERRTRELLQYCSYIKVEAKVVADVTAILTELPAKIIAMDLEDHDKLARFEKQMLPYMEGRLNCFFSNPHMLEIVPAGVSKGDAVRFLSHHLGIPIEHTIAAGDAGNDISMLEAAGVGAVMINALDNIKVYGDYITKRDNNHGGVAEIIEKFMLNDQ